MTSSTVFNPTCSVCHKRMGDMSGEEFEAVVLAEGLGAKCFDCEPKADLECPEVLIPGEVGSVIVIDSQEFWVARNANYELRLRTISHTREHVRTLSCLSSSTNLHKSEIITNRNRELPYTVSDCPECEKPSLLHWDDGKRCGNCGYFESYSQEIVIPAWIVGPLGKKPAKMDDTATCYTCAELRELGAGQYCDYHSALLYELFKDSELGLGHAS